MIRCTTLNPIKIMRLVSVFRFCFALIWAFFWIGCDATSAPALFDWDESGAFLFSVQDEQSGKTYYGSIAFHVERLAEEDVDGMGLSGTWALDADGCGAGKSIPVCSGPFMGVYRLGKPDVIHFNFTSRAPLPETGRIFGMGVTAARITAFYQVTGQMQYLNTQTYNLKDAVPMGHFTAQRVSEKRKI